MSTQLTAEEEAQFTVLNYAAFDLVLVTARDKNEAPPAWLCTSEKSREEAIRRLLDWAKVRLPRQPATWNKESLATVLDNVPEIKSGVVKWRNSELELKRLREEERNPRAFFYPIK